MTLLCNETLVGLCKNDPPLISPFVDRQVREVDGKKVMSFGLTAEGYDFRLRSTGIKIANRNYTKTLDVWDPDPDAFIDSVVGDTGIVTIPANGLLLAYTLEEYALPDDVEMFVSTKSGSARCGISLNFTKVNPGWRGPVVVELQNGMPFPVRINVNHGSGTMLFMRFDGKTTPYEGRFQTTNPMLHQQ
jgi:dCTP deaminase